MQSKNHIIQQQTKQDSNSNQQTKQQTNQTTKSKSNKQTTLSKTIITKYQPPQTTT